MTKRILVPISDTQNITSFSEYARKLFQQGKITYEKFCNIEMVELGYNPSDPKDVEEYNDFIESLNDIADEFDVEFISEMIFGPLEGEDERLEVKCTECGTLHWVAHTEWEALVCLTCEHEMDNPYDNNKGKE
jgi:hypothetical protein